MFVATLDANVLYQSRVRVLLLRAAEGRYGLYRAVWSEQILAETEEALHRKSNLSPVQIARAMSRIREVNEGAVVTGYEALIPVMTNDPDDRHVLAVAVHEAAETIVTWNTSHFPPEACDPYNIQVQTPNGFLANLWDQRPRTMLEVLTATARGFQAPSVGAFLDDLWHLPQLVELVRETELAPLLEEPLVLQRPNAAVPSANLGTLPVEATVFHGWGVSVLRGCLDTGCWGWTEERRSQTVSLGT